MRVFHPKTDRNPNPKAGAIVLRKIAAITLIAAAMVVAPVAANAEVYTPPTPRAGPTLAGSVAEGVCDGDVPWISYSLTLTDPANQSTSHSAFLTMSDGSNSTQLALGEIVDGKLSGRILWPGASVGANGEPTGWPGWMQVNGMWVQTSGNFGWTRNLSSVQITVNPEIVVPLSYPPASPNCASAPPKASVASANVETVSTDPLAGTGVNALVLPIGIGALGVLLIGATILVVRRRMSARSDE